MGGRGPAWSPPSEIATMRATCIPAARAYSSARARARRIASVLASSSAASGRSSASVGPSSWLAPSATSASSTAPERAMSRSRIETLFVA
jgi:hypothetical protein